MRNLPGAKYRVKFTAPFKDGNIFGPVLFKLNEVAEITPEQVEQARRSGAQFDLLETVLPLDHDKLKEPVISSLTESEPEKPVELDPAPALPRRGRKKGGKSEQA